MSRPLSTAERREEIEYVLHDFANEYGVPGVDTASFIIDVESVLGYDLHPDERKVVARWFSDFWDRVLPSPPPRRL